MSQFSAGEEVAIPAKVFPGAFPGEFLVEIDTADGPVSGFVRESDVRNVNINEHSGYVRATIESFDSHSVKVLISGSFFTTNGIAYLSSSWAQSNLQQVA